MAETTDVDVELYEENVGTPAVHQMRWITLVPSECKFHSKNLHTIVY